MIIASDWWLIFFLLKIRSTLITNWKIRLFCSRVLHKFELLLKIAAVAFFDIVNNEI